MSEAISTMANQASLHYIHIELITVIGSCGEGVWEWPLLRNLQLGSFRANLLEVLPLIKDWLQVCEQNHTRCQLESPLICPPRLIEILDYDRGLLRPVDGMNCSSKDATLSYRWGNITTSGYMTTLDNYSGRCSSFQMNSLPNTMQDAITLTYWLNPRYFWIDAM
jgi:hypothetical protein